MGRHVQASARLGFAKLVLAGWVIPSLAVAGPGPRATVRVEIDTSKLPEFDARGIEPGVRGRTELLLDQHGYFLDDAADDAIVVRIEYINEHDQVYRIQIDVLDDGKVVSPSAEPVVCEYCNYRMVADLYAEQLPGALERLAKANAAVEAAVVAEPKQDGTPTAEDKGGGEPEPEDTENGDEPKPRRSLTLRNAGLGLLVPGGVALGVGLGLVAVGTRRVDRGDDIVIWERFYRPPGIAIAAVGGVAAVTGIGLLVVHALRGRGKDGASERITWSPVLGGQTGVVVTTRF